MISPILPSRFPLSGHTLHHIYGQCRSSRARAKFIHREITIIRANVAWGFMDKAMAVVCLDCLRVLIRSPQ